MATEGQAFDGAKVIYIASVRPGVEIEKESEQTETHPDESIIERPWSEERGDLIRYYQNLTDFNSYHARCLRVKVDCNINLGINVIDGNENVLDKLSAVNEYGQSFQEVMSRVALDYESGGNGYLELARGQGGMIGEIYHCPSRYTKRRKRGSEFPFVYDAGQGPVDFHAYRPGEKPGDTKHNELLQISNYTDESRYYGLPDWRGAVPDIEVDYYSVLYNQKFFINSGVPDLAIIVKGGKFDEETEKKVVSFLQTSFKGISNAHRTLYLPIEDQDIEVKFEKLAVDMKDRDGSFDKLRARSRDNIVSAHGVPPRLVGIVVSGQLGGGGEVHGQLKIFQEITINPRQDLFETKLNPLLKDMGHEIKIQFQDLDTKIQEKDSELYPALVGSGILDSDEAREELGYSEREEPAPRTQLPEDQEVSTNPAAELRLINTLERIHKEL